MQVRTGIPSLWLAAGSLLQLALTPRRAPCELLHHRSRPGLGVSCEVSRQRPTRTGGNLQKAVILRSGKGRGALRVPAYSSSPEYGYYHSGYPFLIDIVYKGRALRIPLILSNCQIGKEFWSIIKPFGSPYHAPTHPAPPTSPSQPGGMIPYVRAGLRASKNACPSLTTIRYLQNTIHPLDPPAPHIITTCSQARTE
jgi:hypothetical protein